MKNNLYVVVMSALAISTGALLYERVSYTDILDLKMTSSSKQIKDQINFQIDRGIDLSRLAYELSDDFNACTDEKNEYAAALDEANDNISNAKYSAWESYDDMGYALENLEEVYVW